jgi:hypothetical protein
MLPGITPRIVGIADAVAHLRRTDSSALE